MTKQNKKLMIIDGNALIHRSFHALPPTMTLDSGQAINAVYGFTNFLIKALLEFKPEYIVLTLDKKGPTFRHKKYKEYKANRTKAPDELYSQIPLVKELATAFNIPIFEKSGFEADDLIGTIAGELNGEVDKIIVTGDMDTLQLVNEYTKVYTMSRGMSESVLYGPSEVVNRYKLTPAQIVDYKALRGDPSDNIPGVKGVGEKTATDLLLDFETLDNVYKNLDSLKIKDRTKMLLTNNKEEAYISQDLATIKCDVEIDFKLEDAVTKEFDKDTILKKFNDFEFRSLLPRVKQLFQEFGGEGSSTDNESDEEMVIIDKFARNDKEFKYKLIETDKKFDKFLTTLKKQKEFSFDTETTGVDPLTARLLGISFSFKEGEAYYLNFDKNTDDDKKTSGAGEDNLFNYQEKKVKTNGVDIKNIDWLDKLKPVFEDAGIGKNAHNAKFDVKVLNHVGLDVKGLVFDTMLASYILNPGSRQHSLDALTFTEFNFEKISKADLLGSGREKISYEEVDVKKMANYSCEDADFTHRLYHVLKKRIKKEKFDKLFFEIELPLLEVLAKMENEGVSLDTAFLKKMSASVGKDIKKHEEKIFKLSGKTFNIKSTQQLGIVLFEDMQIPTKGIKKNKKGFSTAFDELEKIKDEHEVIKYIQEYRELTKLYSTYIVSLPKLVNEDTGRVHTSFNQTIAATGRLSSTEPNLQNIPVRTELGREIRKAFVAKDGYVLVALDYSQIELRLAAIMSGDKTMIEAFNNGVDIHRATASLINKVELEDVTKQMRREAKAVNFGILYGQGPHGLAKGADIPYATAKEFIDNYFKVYSGVKKFIDTTIENAKRDEKVETLFGRVRKLPEINSSIGMVKKSAERMAANTPLQGTAADIIKKAMIEVHSKLLSEDVRMLIQVHDELIFEIKKGGEEKYVQEIKDIMEHVVDLTVELKVDAKIGKNWGEMKPIE